MNRWSSSPSHTIKFTQPYNQVHPVIQSSSPSPIYEFKFAYDQLIYPPENWRMSPEKGPFQKERLVFQPSFVRGALLVLGRANWIPFKSTQSISSGIQNHLIIYIYTIYRLQFGNKHWFHTIWIDKVDIKSTSSQRITHSSTQNHSKATALDAHSTHVAWTTQTELQRWCSRYLPCRMRKKMIECFNVKYKFSSSNMLRILGFVVVVTHHILRWSMCKCFKSRVYKRIYLYIV